MEKLLLENQHFLIIVILIIIILLIAFLQSEDHQHSHISHIHNLNNNNRNNNNHSNSNSNNNRNNSNNNHDKFTNTLEFDQTIAYNNHIFNMYANPLEIGLDSTLPTNHDMQINNVDNLDKSHMVLIGNTNVGQPSSSLSFGSLGEIFDKSMPNGTSRFNYSTTSNTHNYDFSYDNIHNITSPKGNSQYLEPEESVDFSSNETQLSTDNIGRHLNHDNQPNKDYWSYQAEQTTNNPNIELMYQYAQEPKEIPELDSALEKDIELAKSLKSNSENVSRQGPNMVHVGNLDTKTIGSSNNVQDSLNSINQKDGKGVNNIFAPHIVVNRPIYISSNMDTSSIGDLLNKNKYHLA